MSSITKSLASATITIPEPTFEQKVLSRLDAIYERLDDLFDKVEALEVRVSDMDLDTGDGFSRESFDE